MQKIKSITIEVSTLCDASCVICPRAQYKYKFANMDFELFKIAVDKAYNAGYSIISLGGYGDPFMSKYIEKCLSYIKNTYPSIQIQASSTCNCLTNRLELLKYVDVLRISMYGITKNTYEKIHRGFVSYDNVMKNINAILNMDKHPYISMNYVILNENKEEMEDWKAYWEPKADEIQIWKPHNWAGLYDTSVNLAEKNKILCFRPFSDEYTVKVNGDISICCWDINHDLVIGNILDAELDKLSSSDKVKSIQNELKAFVAGKNTDLICANCDQCTNRTDALVYSSNKNIVSGRKNYLNVKEK